MGYEYAFIHRPAKMMKDVDALSRRFGKCVAAYLIQTGQMRHRDIVDRPAAYSVDYFLQSPRPSESMLVSLRIFPSLSPIAHPTYYTSPPRYAFVSPTVPLIPTHIPQHSSQTTSHYTTHLPQEWILINATVSSVGHTIATWSGNVLDHHMFEGIEPCALLAKLFSPNFTIDICSIMQLLLHLRYVTENQHTVSPGSDMPKKTTQPSCDGIHLVHRNTRYEVVPSCEDTAGILSAPSCDGTHHHSSTSSCDDTHPLLRIPDCERTNVIDRHTRHEVVPSCEDTADILSTPSCDSTHHHSSVSSCDDTHPLLFIPDCERTSVLDRHTRLAAVPSCEDTTGILSKPSCDGLNMFTCRTLKVFGIDFTFQSLLYSDVMLWTTSCIDVIAILQYHYTLQVFRFDIQSGSAIFDSLHQYLVVVTIQARAVGYHTGDSISIRLW